MLKLKIVDKEIHKRLYADSSTEYTINFDEYHTARIKRTAKSLGYQNEVEFMINAIKNILNLRENETTQLNKNQQKQQERLI